MDPSKGGHGSSDPMANTPMGPSPLPKKGTEPQFSAHVYCAQTAGWIKTALGMEDGKADGCIDTLMSSLHCTKMWRTLVH